MGGYIRERGPALVNKGYPVVAIAAGGKGAVYKDWQARSLAPSECAEWDEDAGVGILCGMEHNPVCAVDVDILDAGFAQYMASFIRGLGLEGCLWRRTGRPPKFLVPFQAAQAGWRKAATPEYFKDGMKAQIEILGKGQQFVAFHVHPDTGKPYTWGPLGTNPKDVFPAYEDLPVIEQEQIEAIMRAFEEYAANHGYAPKKVEAGDVLLAQALTPVVPPIPNMTPGKMHLMLSRLIEGGRLDLGKGTHDEWVKVGMAIHHQTGGSAEGLALWDEISKRFPDAYQDGACAARWRSFHSDRAGGVTFRSYQARCREMLNTPETEANEYGLLCRAQDALKQRAVYLPQVSEWACYDVVREKWEWHRGKALVASAIRDIIRNTLAAEIEESIDDVKRKELKKYRIECLHKLRSREGNIIALLADTPSFVGELEEFDATPDLFGVRNGVLNIRDRSLQPNKAFLRVMRQAGAVYDPAAKCPVWEQCMLDWLDNDEEKVAYVQRLLGQALSGSPKEDVFLLLRGIGCNGKSVFLNTLEKVFGEYAEVLGESTLLGYADGGVGGRARSDLAKLRGARFVFCSETTDGMRLKEADVKRMTGRDVISARAPYGRSEVKIVPSWLLVVGTNHVPEIKGDDEGIWRRIADVEFPRNFMTDPKVRMDPELSDKLEAELSGILNWMLDGYDEYLRIGLATPAKIRRATDEYRDEMDDVRAWSRERLRFTGRDERVPVQMFYADFVMWMKGQGTTNVINLNAFTRRLRKRILSDYKGDYIVRGHGGHRVQGFEIAPPSETDVVDAFTDFSAEDEALLADVI